MKLYFGNTVTTVTTLTILSLLTFIAAVATPIARTQKMREIWFYIMSIGAVLKIVGELYHDKHERE